MGKSQLFAKSGAGIASKLITLRDAVFSFSSTFFIIIRGFFSFVYGWHFQAVDYDQKALAET